MADSNTVNELKTALNHGCSSSSNSVQSESSLDEYSEDFLSSAGSSGSDTERKASLISREIAVDGVRNGAESTKMAEFLRRKLYILAENRALCETNKTQNNRKLLSCEKYEKLSPFWLKKLKILHENSKHDPKRTTCFVKAFSSNARQMAKVEVSSSTHLNSKSSLEIPGNVCCETDYFQAAFERLRFDNLQHRCRRFIECDLHCPRTCDHCKKKIQELSETKFYKKCIRTVNQNDIEHKVESHIQTMTSTLMIANIIEAGPKPSWNSKQLWEKIVLGGYQDICKHS